MKKKRQYLWITVVSVLFLVITGCLGGWMASMYSYARVQEAMSHVIRSTNIDRQENYQEYFESPTSELQESVVTSFLGSKLMDSYIPELDTNGSYQKAIELYQQAENQLLENNVEYFGNYNGYSRSTNSFQDFDSFQMYTSENVSALSWASNGSYQDLEVHYFEMDNYYFTYYLQENQIEVYPNGYQEILNELSELSNILANEQQYEANGMLDAINMILLYQQNPAQYSFGFSISTLNTTPMYTTACQNLMNDVQVSREDQFILMFWGYLLAAVLLICVTLIFNLTGLLRKVYRGLAKLMKHIFLEFKLLFWGATVIAVSCFFIVLFEVYYDTGITTYDFLFHIFITFLPAAITLLLLSALISDLYYNHNNVICNNIINRILKSYRKFARKKPYQKQMHMRIFINMLIWGIAILFNVIGLFTRSAFLYFVSIVALIVSSVYLGNKLSQIAHDMDVVSDKIEQISMGNLTNELSVLPSSELSSVITNLDHLQENIDEEVKNRMKSERMKVELITNVSHDLKTPLTSMVNYINLLEKEELQPEFANDYVKILRNKIDRLKTMTEDLFDVAKANSGNMEVRKEVIELGELLEQTMGENQKEIDASQLDFRIQTSGKVYIEADGAKMYRIFSNIINNTVKYAMHGTRVYIHIFEQDNIATFIVKNVANYEMNFDPEEIYGRFKRGDESRSIEGSGLGLSIVKSFVGLQGGDFHVEIDGDLFKAIVRFPAYHPHKQPETQVAINNMEQKPIYPSYPFEQQPPFYNS